MVTAGTGAALRALTGHSGCALVAVAGTRIPLVLVSRSIQWSLTPAGNYGSAPPSLPQAQAQAQAQVVAGWSGQAPGERECWCDDAAHYLAYYSSLEYAPPPSSTAAMAAAGTAGHPLTVEVLAPQVLLLKNKEPVKPLRPPRGAKRTARGNRG